MLDKNPTASRALYDAGREDVASGVPIHEFPGGSSDQRPHELTKDCWCHPVVEVVPASRVRHQKEGA